eukprot:NODE_13316_length_1172_cov_10.578947.p1 GENE.NODE_13316_length_1172_cov_10.578947~~NODE_13316_length_1172_cov_10.578947.p1  ORF type:complete len:226 (-),score=45.28 NODE_13316_length_1172_cov_10.578947:230-907(-)
MGIQGSVADSPVMSYLRDEFVRVSKESGQLLHLHEIQQLQPPQDCTLDFRHIATLWKLDADHDGCASFEEVLAFAEFCNDRRRLFGALDFEAKLRAQCVVDLWQSVSAHSGDEAFADWVCLLVSQGENQQVFASSPGIKFISRDAVMTLYELMLPYQISSHVDQQGFLDMLQQIAELHGLMLLSAEELDDWVPADVVHRWVRTFITAHMNLFRELSLEPPKSSRE